MVISISSLGGGAPTSDSWGTNNLTMSGDLVLTDSDETIQSLTTSVERDVTLPVITSATPHFVVINNAASAAVITLKDTSGNVMANIGIDQIARVWTDGIVAFATITGKASSVASTAQNVYYWSNPAAFGNFFVAQGAGSGQSVINASTTQSLEQVVAEAGTIVGLSIAGSVTSVVVEILVNGSIAFTSASTAAVNEVQVVSVAIVAGDTIAVRKSATSAAMSIKVITTTTAVPTSNFTYLGDASVIDHFIVAHGNDLVGGNLANHNSQYLNIVHSPGMIRSVGWNVETTGATLEILVNETIKGTASLSTNQGSVILASPIPVNPGDVVSVRSAIVASNRMGINLYLTSNGTNATFGSQGSNTFYFLSGRAAGNSSVAAIDNKTSYTVNTTCRLAAIGLAQQAPSTSSGDQNLGIWKNGTLLGFERIAPANNQYILAENTYSFVSGDFLDISYDGLTTSFGSVLSVLLV